MNDNDIVKALATCIAGNCTEIGCPLFDENDTDDCTVCMTKLIEHALDLINRQKADIERLKKHNTEMARKHYSDGIKEFAERLKKSSFPCDVSFGFGREHCEEAVTVLEIDNLVKEMTEETP